MVITHGQTPNLHTTTHALSVHINRQTSNLYNSEMYITTLGQMVITHGQTSNLHTTTHA